MQEIFRLKKAREGKIRWERSLIQQTGEARIIFAEQTGLVRIVPTELIFEIINGFATPQEAPDAKVQDAGLEKTEC